MPLVKYERLIPEIKRLQTYALDRTAISSAIDHILYCMMYT